MAKGEKQDTSWEKVSNWYDTLTKEEGHYYHQHLILPGVLKLLNFKKHGSDSLLDVGCGQGILGRVIPPHIPYHGVDLSPSLITQAKKYDKNKNHRYSVSDVTQPLLFKDKFSHATLILCLQNIEKPQAVFTQIAKNLHEGASLVIVLNHPCFRIPRQSSWGMDEERKIQYRRLDLYLSAQKIPITTHPGKKESTHTLSYHFPLQDYFHFLNNAGFAVHWMEEWASDKKSVGAKAKMENRARKEFPLFLAIVAKMSK